MEVDLSCFFSGRGTLVRDRDAEVAIARAFAAAANARRDGHERLAASERVPVSLRVRAADGRWSRQLKDVVLRCVDRAVSRVYPPLDVLQYISEDSPAFEVGGAEAGAASVVFSLCPSTALLPPSVAKPHTVEGEAVGGVVLPESASADAVTAAATELAKDTLSDMDLWYRARAAHQQYDSSIPLDSIQQLADSLLRPGQGEGGVADEAAAQLQQQRQREKLEQLQWQLARWLTEAFLNEGGWARSVAGATPAGAAGGGGGAAASSAGAAARRLFHAPLRPSFPHVVDAALFSAASPHRAVAPSSSPDGAEAPHQGAAAGQRRQLHADVRGVEWDGLLIGSTARYAYVAVPYFVSAAESPSATPSCVWSLVSRVPVPSFMPDDRGTASPSPSSLPAHSAASARKRTRSVPEADSNAPPAVPQPDSTASLAQRVLSMCFNVDEVMRHDSHAHKTFRLAASPYVVTVRAHRVYCARADSTKEPVLAAAPRSSAASCAKVPHPATSPFKLSMVLEDAYVVAHRPAATSTSSDAQESAVALHSAEHWAAALFPAEAAPRLASTATPALVNELARSMHTYADVVSVLRESCHRFLRSHERFCDLYQRSMEARKQAAAAAAQSAAKALPSDSEKAAVSDTTLDDGQAADAEATRERELPPLAVATQQLRLLRSAEDAYAAVADSVSVHYKKLRGAARVAIPAVRTSADILPLEESYNVEFKASVGLAAGGAAADALGSGRGGRARQAASMDTERLRNTIAAMASCRGGVVVVGVADDGRLVGHARQLEVGKHLRTSGFCPAMVKDAVQVKELRLLDSAKAAATAATAAESTPVKRAMPENWWKAGGTGGGAAKGSARDGKGPAAPHGASVESVLTVISVEKGQAPFYATSKNAPPYQRGCASTVVMPTAVVARRLMKGLE